MKIVLLAAVVLGILATVACSAGTTVKEIPGEGGPTKIPTMVQPSNEVDALIQQVKDLQDRLEQRESRIEELRWTEEEAAGIVEERLQEALKDCEITCPSDFVSLLSGVTISGGEFPSTLLPTIAKSLLRDGEWTARHDPMSGVWKVDVDWGISTRGTFYATERKGLVEGGGGGGAVAPPFIPIDLAFEAFLGELYPSGITSNTRAALESQFSAVEPFYDVGRNLGWVAADLPLLDFIRKYTGLGGLDPNAAADALVDLFNTINVTDRQAFARDALANDPDTQFRIVLAANLQGTPAPLADGARSINARRYAQWFASLPLVDGQPDFVSNPYLLTGMN